MNEPTNRNQDERSELEDLAEVIRLQAEALARISGRMGGHQSPLRQEAPLAPPPRPVQAPRDHAAPISAVRPNQLPVLAADPALSEDSLPVLNTFKNFLEAERRRARIRMLVASFVFVLLLAGVFASFLYLGRAHLAQLYDKLKAAQDRTQQLQDRTVQLKEDVKTVQETALRDSTETDSKLRKVATDAKAAAEAATGLQRALTNTLLAANSNIAAQLDSRDVEIQRLKDELTSMQVENASMASTLNEILNQATQSPVPDTNAENQATTAAGTNESPSAAGADRTTLPLTIDSPGLGRPVQFRLPMSR